MNILARKANIGDLKDIKKIADDNKRAIGFISHPIFKESIKRKQLYISLDGDQITGFINYRHRKDNQTTIYEVCVIGEFRLQGHGTALMDAVINESLSLGKKYIQLKCPADLDANIFYFNLDFMIESTRERTNFKKLIVWQYNLENRNKIEKLICERNNNGLKFKKVIT